MTFLTVIEKNPVIAAIRSAHQLGPALESDCGVLFLLSAEIRTLPETMEQVHAAGKQAFVHVDLMEGVARDRPGLQYLRDVCRIDGILTTQAYAIRMAREEGLPTIQRMFLIDSQSIATGSQSVQQNRPHAIEIMPGIMPGITQKMVESTSQPVIAGGFVETKAQVLAALKAGAVGVSTSREELWNL